MFLAGRYQAAHVIASASLVRSAFFVGCREDSRRGAVPRPGRDPRPGLLRGQYKKPPTYL